MKTQYDRLALLLTRPGGCTSVDVMRTLPSTCPHKRLSDMAGKGWKVQKTQVGKLIRYTGQPPTPEKSSYVPKTVWQPRNILAEMSKWEE